MASRTANGDSVHFNALLTQPIVAMRETGAMRRSVGILALSGLGLALSAFAFRELLPSTTGVGVRPESLDGAARLHNGWVVKPAGMQTRIEDFPTQLAVSPDDKWLAVGTSGYGTHQIRIYSVGAAPARSLGSDTRQDMRVRCTVTLPQIYKGFEFSGKALLVSGGKSGLIHRYSISETGYLTLDGTVEVPGEGARKAYVGQIKVLSDSSLLALDEGADKPGDILYHLDPQGKVLNKIEVGVNASAFGVSPDQAKAYVADYGAGDVLEVDLTTAKGTRKVATGAQPEAVLVAKEGTIYVANSGADTVSVVDPSELKVTSTIKMGITPNAPLGSVPNSLSFSADESKLYVTNAGNNNVAVVLLEKAEPKVEGFVPTGWYPVASCVTKNGWLFAATGKGLEPSRNDIGTGDSMSIRVGQPAGAGYGPKRDRNLQYNYVMSNLQGIIQRIAEPNDGELKAHTEVVRKVTPYADRLLAKADAKPKDSVLPDSHSEKSPFEHVVYIIKENRTYDQVFGDMPKGNGDSNLVLFGREITPNHHAIAEQFVLLDNTYCDGDVSQDGWEWSTSANDSDWNIKASALSYGGRGNPPGTREEIRPSNGYLWEHAEKKGLTYFSYGAKTWRGLFSPTLKGNFSKEWNQGRTDGVPDHLKADIFVKDIKEAEKTGKWPNFIMMSLADDHTSGTAPGAHTPEAAVASNDIALGKVVEAITKSKFWAKTAIFVIEDDAQNGPDHVDAHRTVALVASPYTKAGTLDSTMYTSCSLMRTMELCLGIAPTSQYDAAAAPMFRCFTGKKNLKPFSPLVPKVDLNAKNSARAVMAAESAKMDFSDVDLADFGTLNRILWAHRKPGVPYPGTVSAFR